MQIRSLRERVIQTLSYEAGGLLVATPLYMLVFGSSVGTSVLLMLALSVAVMLWSPLHNTAFDCVEWRLARRVASDRPHLWRLVHAGSHELSTIIVTLPIIVVLGGHSLWQSLAIDLGLTLFYAAYAYCFHICYDLLRPVRRREEVIRSTQQPLNMG